GKDVENIVQGESFSVDLTSVIQYASIDSTVVFGVAHFDKNGEIKEVVGKSSKRNVSGSFVDVTDKILELGSEEAFNNYLQQNPDFIEKIAKSVFNETITCKIQQPIEEGDRLIAVSQSNDAEQWYPIFTYMTDDEEQQGSEGSEDDEEEVVELAPYFIDLTAGATANEKVVAVANQSLCVRGNVLILQTEEPLKASVYNISGALVKQQTVAGTAQIALPKGIYVVQLGVKAYKVVIKK
ncbi:MAG: T9SS type A sorting domain-containing protein, partial [Parabacteroides sp.]|nr:T9SS type A sorting domain-containing protein [Parabacteroides sp.]